MRILTIYMCKNRRVFHPENYASVVHQKGVEQDIYVVSTEPLMTEGVRDIVVPVKEEWPLPIRVGYSINTALGVLNRAGKKLDRYSYLFTVDNDVLLPSDYLKTLIAKGSPIAGVGPALLISTLFFLTKLNGKYPLKHCDDGYVAALSVSIGAWPPAYDGKGRLILPPIRYIHAREFAYGVEYYKWGLPTQLLILIPVASRLLKLMPHEKRSFGANLTNIAGYLWAALHRVKKYSFHEKYGRMRSRHFAEKSLRVLLLKR